MTTFVHMVAVIGPPGPPSPDAIKQVLLQSTLEGALPPVLIDAISRSPDGLRALRNLKYTHFAGAPLPSTTVQLLHMYR
ncbi:hypothetical protein N7468_008085 [Penicillium chermesinum]|uniref:Uncharacterized protein n=1 Tax=Penicillium chermesinum TaxID=63820 RepID=A0A9W9NPI6_9EURO|nr:uncharacterized protein N7468_008085 [Penicillium chermesinum]KAJ5223543.1 hypothetical protein N7468_008085 [Penicillium chermesinum]